MEKNMKKILLVMIICMFAGIGCTSVSQDIDISNTSDIENCKIEYNLRTYLWRGSEIEFSRYRYNLTKQELLKLKIQDKNEALAILECAEAMEVIKMN